MRLLLSSALAVLLAGLYYRYMLEDDMPVPVEGQRDFFLFGSPISSSPPHIPLQDEHRLTMDVQATRCLHWHTTPSSSNSDSTRRTATVSTRLRTSATAPSSDCFVPLHSPAQQ